MAVTAVPSVFHIHDDIVMVAAVAAVDLVLMVVMVGMMVVVEEVVVVMTDGSFVSVVVVEFVNGSLSNSMLVIRNHFEYYSY